MSDLVRLQFSDTPPGMREGVVATLTLNRPARANALVPDLIHTLLQRLDEVRAARPDVVILRTEGRTFSTGGDVAGFYQQAKHQRAAYAEALVGGLHDAILALTQMPCPTVAQIHGMVTGGSLGLVLACDITIGTPEASFTPWYARVGYAPDGGWTALLPERIGTASALDLLLTNRTLDATEAHQKGVLTYLVAAEQLQHCTDHVVEQLLAGYSSSHRHTLRLLRPNTLQLAAKLRAEQQRFCQQIESPDAEAGMAAYLRLPA